MQVGPECASVVRLEDRVAMAIATAETKTYTADEYLALEVEAEGRSEFRDGKIVAMTGGTPTHNELVGSFYLLLRLALKGKPWATYVMDQRLWVPESNLYVYPDLMVTPRPSELQPGRRDTVVNPIVVAEVLSPSTERYDRGEKFAAYRSIASLQEYVLVSQSRVQVEQFVRQADDRWVLTVVSGMEAAIALATVPLEFTLAKLYEEVALEL